MTTLMNIDRHKAGCRSLEASRWFTSQVRWLANKHGILLVNLKVNILTRIGRYWSSRLWDFNWSAANASRYLCWFATCNEDIETNTLDPRKTHASVYFESNRNPTFRLTQLSNSYLLPMGKPKEWICLTLTNKNDCAYLTSTTWLTWPDYWTY